MHNIINCLTIVVISLIILGEILLCADALTFIPYTNANCDYILTVTDILAGYDFFVGIICVFSMIYAFLCRKKLSCVVKCTMLLHSPLIIYVFAVVLDYYHDKSCYNFIIDDAPTRRVFLLINFVMGFIVLALFVILSMVYVCSVQNNCFKKYQTYEKVQQITKLESVPESKPTSTQMIELTKINSIV
jgi:hypothetical protein